MSTPGLLLDYIKLMIGVKKDKELCNFLEVDPPMISNMRGGHIPVGSTMLLRIHDFTGIPVNELRELAGLKEVKPKSW